MTSSPEFGLILSLLVACQVRRSHVPRLNGSSCASATYFVSFKKRIAMKICSRNFFLYFYFSYSPVFCILFVDVVFFFLRKCNRYIFYLFYLFNNNDAIFITFYNFKYGFIVLLLLSSLMNVCNNECYLFFTVFKLYFHMIYFHMDVELLEFLVLTYK